jgi:hypothetical protein
MRPRLVAGLIPEPLGPMSDEDRQAITERAALVESRACLLAAEAIKAGEAWVRRLGDPPTSPAVRGQWADAVATVAAYRDRYEVDSNRPAGARATTAAQEVDRQRAIKAAQQAVTLAGASGSRLGPATFDVVGHLRSTDRDPGVSVHSR